MRIPEETINEIRTSVDILDALSPYLEGVAKKGRNFFAYCPFHEERTGSFSINQDKQIFHCFSCGRGGNVFKFFMDLEGLTFPQSVARVAAISGKPLDEKYINDSSANRYDDHQLQIIDLNDQATRLYHLLLTNTDAGKPALDYLINQRKLSRELIDQFQIGFVPGQTSLYDSLTQKNISQDLMSESELFLQNDRGIWRDRFANRIVFPIKDDDGKVLGFSGRSIRADDSIKYMNSPESSIFKKNQILFNFNTARAQARNSKKIILMEGFMDVISAYQAGVDYAVASMGTSLTIEQIRKIGKVTPKVAVAYDADSAGMNAANRVLDLLKANTNLEVEVILFPQNQDPDEYRTSKGDQALKNVLEQSGLTTGAFMLQYLKNDKNLSIEAERINYLNQSLEAIKKYDSPIEMELHLDQLAKEFQLEKSSLKQQLNEIKIVEKNNSFNESEKPKLEQTINTVHQLSRLEKAEQSLLESLFDFPETWEQLEKLPEFTFQHAAYQTIYNLAEGYRAKHRNAKINPAEFLDWLQNEDYSRLLAAIIMNPDSQYNSQAVNDYIDLIMNVQPLENQLVELQRKLEDAKTLNNQELVSKLTLEIIDLQKKKDRKVI